MTADPAETSATPSDSPSTVVNAVEVRPFSDGRAIATKSNDRLGRAGFAGSIADSILGWQSDESLVVALTGEWGSGKSSVKNMVLERIGESSAPRRPQIIQFNPWQWTGPEALSAAFLRELGLALETGDGGVRDAETAKVWHSYAARLSSVAFVADTAHRTAATNSVVGTVAGLFVAQWLPGWWKAIPLGFAGLSGVVASTLRWGSEAAKAKAERLAARGNAASKSTDTLRDELRVRLKDRETPLLVVIDDVDRLSASEVALLFQLIKSSADLPRILYFVLFQRDLVEKSLEAIAPRAADGHGRSYLEKIVQVGFTMPSIEMARLETVLFEEINKVLADPVMDRHFDQHRWGNLFQGSLREFFTTLRDVNRFANTFSFHAGIFRGETALEVNPVDLIALEALRVFEPDVYSAAVQLKGVVTGSDGSGSSKEAKEVDRKAIVALVELSNPRRREAVREMIIQLFPPAAWALEKEQFLENDAWLRDLRVCHPDVFDRYFYFAVPTGDLSRNELDRLLAEAGDREAFRQLLLNFDKRGLLLTALDRLESFKETLAPGHVTATAAALFDIGDSFSDAKTRLMMSADILAARTIQSLLRRLGSSAERRERLAEAIGLTNGVFLPMRQVSWLAPPQKDSGASATDRLVTDEDYDALRGLVLDKLGAVPDDMLVRSPHLGWILYRWKEMGADNHAADAAARIISTPVGALRFIAGMSRHVQSMTLGDHVPRVRYETNLKDLTAFVSLDTLMQQVGALDEALLVESDRLVLAGFRRAVAKQESAGTESVDDVDEE